MASAIDKEPLQKALKWFDEDRIHHYQFVRNVERNYRTYRAVVDPTSEAAGWHSQHYPAYVFQVIETLVAGIVDPTPKWRLRARPKLTSIDQIERLKKGAKAHELVLDYQLEADHFAEKQRTRDLQGFIAGLTVTQQGWHHETGIARRLKVIEEPVRNIFGIQTGTRPVVKEVAEETVLHDDATSEVVDVRDFIWPESAISLPKAPRLHRRHWFTFDELKKREAEGLIGAKAGGEPVDLLKESQDQATSEGVYDREQQLFNVNRGKGLIEVIESWIDGGRRVVTFANRSVLLGIRDNPYWFERLEHRYPFAACAGAPDLFRIPGISEVEVIRELQEMVWTLGNQRLDTLRLINNAVAIVHPDYDGDFDIYPGAVNEASSPGEVQMWSPDVRLADLSMNAEQAIKGDLQNIPGASPALLGMADPSAQTATEVSLLTNLAQRRLAAKKQQYVWASRRVGEQWSALNQQYIRATRLVPIVGDDGADAYLEIGPDVLDGDFAFSTEMIDESLMRQDRRAEQTSKLQVALNGAGVMAALAQTGHARMLNLDAFWEDFLEVGYDVDDVDRYFSAGAPNVPPGPQQPQQPNVDAGNGQGGVTSPLATDQNSPSNAFSQSPVAALQRLAAGSGGGNNA